jgi:hypothetical protein
MPIASLPGAFLPSSWVTAHGDRITKHTGDGVTAAFDGGQPLAQLRFAAEPWTEIGALPIRTGLHAGGCPPELVVLDRIRQDDPAAYRNASPFVGSASAPWAGAKTA